MPAKSELFSVLKIYCGENSNFIFSLYQPLLPSSEECELDGPGVQYTFYEITLASFVIDPSQNVVINYPSNPNELSYPWIYYEPHTYPCHGVLNVCGKQKNHS